MDHSIIVSEQPSSIEITKNTKGFTWSVKSYGNNANEISIKLTALIEATKVKIRELESSI